LYPTDKGPIDTYQLGHDGRVEYLSAEIGVDHLNKGKVHVCPVYKKILQIQTFVRNYFDPRSEHDRRLEKMGKRAR
jgi:hypothetical protein